VCLTSAGTDFAGHSKRLPEPSRSIATLLAMTGLRVGELLALRWQDIDFDKGFFSVKQTVYEGHFDVPKSKRSKRTLPLGPVCAQILTSLRKPGVSPSTLVFSTRNGSPLSRRNLLNRQLKPVCKALGLTGANWHWLRHAHATLLDSVGAPLGTVQALLGHSSSAITRETYIDYARDIHRLRARHTSSRFLPARGRRWRESKGCLEPGDL
jgi:integrase